MTNEQDTPKVDLEVVQGEIVESAEQVHNRICDNEVFKRFGSCVYDLKQYLKEKKKELNKNG